MRTLKSFLATALLPLASFALFPAPARAEGHGHVVIAAAANLVQALDTLDGAFAQTEPGVVLTTSIGSSGNLFAQIRHGAPFDVFLSADLDFPRRLAKTGDAEAASLVPFAVGRLVLWTTRPGVDLTSIPATVRSPAVRKLALANPAIAPYGRAAQQTLVRLGLLAEAEPKIVTGGDISQTAQFVATGNADAGFVALSLVLSPRLRDRGRWIEVPANLYDPLEQGAVLTRRGAGNPAARRYLLFIRSPAAQKILERFGYGIPR